jgi:hypothetical protein
VRTPVDADVVLHGEVTPRPAPHATASTGPASIPPRRRVIGDDRPVDLSSALDGLPWVSGVLAAVQAVLLSLLVVVLPAVAAFVVTSADPANDGVSWTRAVGVGAAVWLLAHGVPAEVGGVVVSLVPLGLTALAVFTCFASARRSAVPGRAPLAAGVAAYTVLVVGLAVLRGAGTGGLLRAAAGGAVVASVGLWAGMVRRADGLGIRRAAGPVWSRLPQVVRVAVVGAGVAVAALVLVAALVATGWVVRGRGTVAEVARGLDLDVVAAGVLAVAQLVWVPDMVVWAIAWIAGPGFAVGAGSHLSTAEVVVGPLPALPLLGALPTATGGGLVVLPGLVVLAGCAGGVLVARRLVHTRWWQPAATSALLGLLAGLGVAALTAAASGGVGPGRMATVGAQPALVGALVGGYVALGAGLVATAASPVVRAGVRRALGRRAAD